MTQQIQQWMISDISEQSPMGVAEWNDEQPSCYSLSDSLNLKNKNNNLILPAAPSLIISSTSITCCKTVIFSEFSEVFYITHVDDISESEKDASWYTPEEYSKFKRDVKLTLFLMKNKEKDLLNNESIEYTTRGLEYRTATGKWSRLRNKQDAYDAILTEQEYQWNRQSFDDEAIRRVYRNVSVKCAELAAGLAMRDQEECYGGI